MSAASKASLKRASSSRCAGVSGTAPPPAGSAIDSIAARARCRALLAEATRGVEHLGDLGRAVPEHVAQHQHRPLAGRDPLQAGDEGEADRLLGLVAGVGPLCPVGQPLEQGVGIGLEPDRLAAPGRLRRPGRAARRVHVLGPPALVAERVEAAVGGDPVEPGAQRGAPLEPGEPAPGREQRLLDHVLGVLERAEDSVAVQLQLAAVRIGEGAEGLLVAVSGALQRCVGHLLSVPRSESSSRVHGPVVTPDWGETHRSIRKSARVLPT